jgi:hypothetical protein
MLHIQLSNNALSYITVICILQVEELLASDVKRTQLLRVLRMLCLQVGSIVLTVQYLWWYPVCCR